ncbi:MAG: hypothetical protein COB66_04105 [Coxiella sp. (in: Bacteria)]|nr:MAG: hypothetical protein COB66_04105 [Coxiella sp. (in: g-proteobacteria)]
MRRMKRGAYAPDSRTLRYTYNGDADITFGFTGCWTHDEGTDAVLEALKKKKPDLIFHLGDIYYDLLDDGIASPAKKQSKLVEPFNGYEGDVLLVSGNHEENVHGMRGKVGAATKHLIHTSWPGEEWNRGALRKGMRNVRQLESMNQFFMPEDGYYTITCAHDARGEDGDANIQFIVLNTNRLPYDYVQIAWLKRTLRESTTDKILFVEHHPEVTYGKRKYSDGDGLMYAKFMQTRITKLGRHKEAAAVLERYRLLADQAGTGHVDILKHVIETEVLGADDMPANIRAKVVFNIAAHDHYSSVTATEECNQVTVGAGGKKKLGKGKYVADDRDIGEVLFFEGQQAAGFCLSVASNDLAAGVTGEFVSGVVDGAVHSIASLEIAVDRSMSVSAKGSEPGYYETTRGIDRTTAADPRWYRSNRIGEHSITIERARRNALAFPEMTHLFEEFETSLTRLAGQLQLPTRPHEIFMAERASSGNLTRLVHLLHRSRLMDNAMRREHHKKGSAKDKHLHALLPVMTGAINGLCQAAEDGGSFEEIVPFDYDIGKDLQKALIKLRKKHGHSHPTFSSTVLPVFIGLFMIVATLYVLKGSVLGLPSVQLVDWAGWQEGGTLLAVTLGAHFGASKRRKAVEESFEATLTRYLGTLTKTVKAYTDAPLMVDEPTSICCPC